MNIMFFSYARFIKIYKRECCLKLLRYRCDRRLKTIFSSYSSQAT